MLEIEGTEGVKSVIKSEKREANRKIKEYHYWVSDSKEKLPKLKYQAPSRFTDEGDGFMNLYHVYSCYELGVGRVATRRIPCHCENCQLQITKAWIPRTEPKDQPRFKLVDNCKYINYFGDKNRWYFVDLQQRTEKNPNHYSYMDEDANLYRKDLRDHIGNQMYTQIKEGNVGAIVVDDEETEGYYLVEWVGSPFYQTIDGVETLMCSGIYWNQVKRAPRWYTRTNPVEQEDHILNHVIHPNVLLHPISDQNQLPNGCRKADATAKGAMKLDLHTHDEIIDEIIRRETLEHIESESENENEDKIASEDEEESDDSSIDISLNNSSSSSSNSNSSCSESE